MGKIKNLGWSKGKMTIFQKIKEIYIFSFFDKGTIKQFSQPDLPAQS